MRITNSAIMLTIALAACGPQIAVNVTSGGDAEGGGPESTSGSEGSSGAGASETGAGSSSSGLPADTSTTSTATTTGEDTSSGEGSSTSRGESTGDSTTGDGCSVQLFGGAEQCVCDSMPADPSLCGCDFIGPVCICGDTVYPDEVCGLPACVPDESGVCYCDGEPSDQEACSWMDPTSFTCGCVVGIDQVCRCDTGDYPMALCLPC